MPYWQLFYHLVWSTKNREPFLTPSIEKHIYGYLTGKAVGLAGVVYALGGTVDHMPKGQSYLFSSTRLPGTSGHA